jgi:FKBP-type peptidyl-prolyl cis-trans isomerase (trigger factor)
MSRAPKVDTVTFRIDSVLKIAFAEIAAEEAKPVGELLRELVRERVEQKARRSFEAEARRQALEAAAAAQDAGSDEAAVMDELEADLEGFADEWK